MYLTINFFSIPQDGRHFIYVMKSNAFKKFKGPNSIMSISVGQIIQIVLLCNNKKVNNFITP